MSQANQTTPAELSPEKLKEKNMRAMLKLVRDFEALSSNNDRSWVMNELAGVQAKLAEPSSAV